MELIQITKLGKAYKKYPNRWARFAEWFMPFVGIMHKLNWVLNDITFNLRKGEAIGIIGENGAGKSTLLKLITGTIQPTSGHIDVNGRVAALLELGMGFHPDFTGKQNVFMAGQLSGFSTDKIKEVLPEIEEFAGIGEYIDQPVRIYSSGMQVRLAFSVATSVRPDILIVDEALSVGDAAFKRKCFQRIEKFLKEGTTLMFVTHDIETVKRICSKAIYLKNGHINSFGDAKSVCEKYEKYLIEGRDDSIKNTTEISTFKNSESEIGADCKVEYGDGGAEVLLRTFIDKFGKAVKVIQTGEELTFYFKVKFNRSVNSPIFGMQIKTLEGVPLYGVNSEFLNAKVRKIKIKETSEVFFKLQTYLAPGTYYFNCAVREKLENETNLLCREIDTAILKVVQKTEATVAVGLVDLGADFRIQLDSGEEISS